MRFITYNRLDPGAYRDAIERVRACVERDDFKTARVGVTGVSLNRPAEETYGSMPVVEDLVRLAALRLPRAVAYLCVTDPPSVHVDSLFSDDIRLWLVDGRWHGTLDGRTRLPLASGAPLGCTMAPGAGLAVRPFVETEAGCGVHPAMPAVLESLASHFVLDSVALGIERMIWAEGGDAPAFGQAFVLRPAHDAPRMKSDHPARRAAAPPPRRGK